MYDGTLWEVLAKEQTAKRGYALYAPSTKAAKQKGVLPHAKAGEMTPAKSAREPTAMDGTPLVGKKLK